MALFLAGDFFSHRKRRKRRLCRSGEEGKHNDYGFWHIFVYPGCEKDALRILQHHVEQQHKDRDFSVSKVYRSRKEPRHFYILEEFPDWDTFVAHRSARDYGKYIVTNLYGMIEIETFSIDAYDLVLSSEIQQSSPG